jgi:hypothetical protein
MEHQASNDEITNLTLHLMAALNGVVINRYDYNTNGSRGDIIKKIKVPIKFGGKTRQLEETINIKGHVKLPIVSVFMNGFNLDLDKNSAKNRERTVGGWDGTDNYKTYKYPTPVKISYTVKIVTTKKSDFDQIISHYTTAFNPDIMVSWKHPFENDKIVSKVLWDGNVNIDFPTDLPSTQKARNIGTMNLTLEGWVFRDEQNEVSPLNCIEFNINTISEQGGVFVAEQVDDTFTLTAKPEIQEIVPDCIKAGKYVTLYGNNLSDITAIFALQVNGNGLVTQNYDPFFASEKFAEDCPAFDGYMFETFDVLNTNTIAVQIPEEFEGNDIDFLVINRHGGCSKLSTATEVDSECHQPFLKVF